jgi:hypothetical protein
MTVAQARAEFLLRVKDTSDIDALGGTFLKWCSYVNRYFYRQVTNIMPESYIKTQTYNTVVGTESYTLPTDFQDIIPMGTGLFEISAAGVNTDNRQAITNFGSTKNGFYLNLTSIVLTPKPTEVRSYNFRYIPLLADLSSESSTFLIPDRFSQYLMDALDTMRLVWDEDPSGEAWNDERVRASLNELIQLINPVGQAIMLPDFTEQYYY